VADAQQAFRKRPIVISASQWFKHGDHPAVERYLDTAEGIERLTPEMQIAWGKFAREFAGITTLEGVMRVSPGDWIITGIQGEFYPCKPDIFAATYEPADAPPIAQQGSVEVLDEAMVLAACNAYDEAARMDGETRNELAQYVWMYSAVKAALASKADGGES
jgi:hypothetical protein